MSFMSKLENKWGKLLLIFLITFTFMVISLIVDTASDTAFALCSLLVYVAMPVLYFCTVVMNYLRFSVAKFFRFILYVASALLGLLGAILLLFGPLFAIPFFEWQGFGQAFVYGSSLGSIVTYTILYREFQYNGQTPDHAERRTWLQDIIYYAIAYTAPFILMGILFVIIKAVGQTWFLVVALILIAVFTIIWIIRSIVDYGLPLGNSQEWDDYSSTHSYSSSSSSESLSSEPDVSEIRSSIKHLFATTNGCWCEAESVSIDQSNGMYYITVYCRYKNDSHMTDDSFRDPSIQASARESLKWKVESLLDRSGISYSLDMR